MNRLSKKILEINLFYMLAAVLLLVVGTMVQQRNLISGLLITEWLLIMFPSLIFLKFHKISFGEIRFRPIKVKNGFLVVLITMLLYPIVLFMNVSFLFLLKIFIDFDFNSMPVPKDFNQYLLYIPAMVLSAGICEEFLFRGLIMSRFRIFGRKNAIVLSAVLFGIFHFNYQNIIGPVVLGVIFGYLVYKTGSLMAAVIGHITNNMISLTLAYISMAMASDKSLENTMNATDLIGSVIFIGIIALVCIYLIMFLMNRINEEPVKTEGCANFVFLSEVGFLPWFPVLAVTIGYLIINIFVITISF